MDKHMQDACRHQHFSDGLVIFDIEDGGAYVDIAFLFAGNAQRRIVIRLLFIAPSNDPVAAETLHRMIHRDIAKQVSIQVVSFYNRAVEQHSAADGNPFGKPEAQFSLLLDELNYLYTTIVDMIFRIAQSERIELLFFGADNPQLKRVYDRYIARYAEKLGFSYTTDGAYYAIRTQHYPGSR